MLFILFMKHKKKLVFKSVMEEQPSS